MENSFTRLSICLFMIFTLASCDRGSVEPDLRNTNWTDDDGNTVEFGFSQMKVNGSNIRQKYEKIFIEEGQIYVENKDKDRLYRYDYRIKGSCLFLNFDLSSVFIDPSSKSLSPDADKYNRN